ncbi:hypothetical protein V6N13_109174 [Hibiscus sabdariffa]|uniref:Uncharacterized protein n=1 Tax=Hibiscus sabdariffa TaxID=183260 RepID=A0ABR2FNX0_9ROSI
MRLHVEAAVEKCDERGVAFIEDQRVLTFPELPKEGGEEDIPRDMLPLNKFAASEVGEDPRCGACGKRMESARRKSTTSRYQL